MQFRSAKHATDGGTSRRFFDRFHTPRTSSKRRRAPVLEMLGGRTLLSITPSWNGGAVQFVGDSAGNDTLVLYETTISGSSGFGYSLDGGATKLTSIGGNSLLKSAVTSFTVDFSADSASTLTIADNFTETLAPWSFDTPVTLIGDSSGPATLETTGVATTWSLAVDRLSTEHPITGNVNNPAGPGDAITYSGVGTLNADPTTANTLTGESGYTSIWTLSGSANAGAYTDTYSNSVAFSGFGTLTAGSGALDNLTGETGTTSNWGLTTSANDGTYSDGTTSVNFTNFETLTSESSTTNTLTGETGATSNWILSGSAYDGTYYDGTNTVAFSGIHTLTAGSGATDTLEGESSVTSTWTLGTSANAGTYYDGTNTVAFSGFHTLTAGLNATDTLVGQNTVNTTWTLGTSANDGNYTSSSTTVNFTGFDTLQGGTISSTTNTLVGENNALSTWTLGTSPYTYSDSSNSLVTFSNFNALQGGTTGSVGNEFDVSTTFTGSLTGGGTGGHDTFNLLDGGSVSGGGTGHPGIVGQSGDSTIYYFAAVNVNLSDHNTIGYSGNETTSVSGGFTGINAVNAVTGGTLTGNANTSTWDLAALTFQDTTPSTLLKLAFSGFGTLVGGSGADTFNINAATPPRLNLEGGGIRSSTDNFIFTAGDTLNGTINGEAGTSTLTYSAYTSAVTVNLGTAMATGTLAISNIAGLVGTTHANTTLVGPNAATTWTIDGPNSGSLSSGFTFSSVQNLSGGVRANTFDLADGASVSGTITGGSTSDTLNLEGSDDATVYIGVNSGGGTTGNNLGYVSISSTTVLNFSGIANVTGTSGIEHYVLSNGMGLTGTLTGGGGTNDTLDYSAYSTGVRVNLTTKSATSIDGGRINGIIGIANVTGGSGNDILIGDANSDAYVNNALDGGSGGNDILVGVGGIDTLTVRGTGRNILIGGAGTGTHLNSSAATGENLLIGGIVSFDTNLAALNSLMAEWSRTGVSFATRVAHLNGTLAGGLNGSYKLITSGSGQTVSNDSGTSTLTGDPTLTDGATWFIASIADTVHKKTGTKDQVDLIPA